MTARLSIQPSMRNHLPQRRRNALLWGTAALMVVLSLLQFWMASTWRNDDSRESSRTAWDRNSWKIQSYSARTGGNVKDYDEPSHPTTTRITPSNTTTTSTAATPKFLYGIMSYDKKIEQRRRQNIRRTYLSFYRDFSTTPNRICALADVLLLQAGDPLLDECQIIYAFVIGGNPNGPTQLLEFNESFPLIINPSQIPNTAEERDIVYLNIQENGKYGKSPTWFKYGVTLWQSYPHLKLDYIVKTDSDTALYPYHFFEMVQRHGLQSYPNNLLTYGGSPFDKYMCGYPEHDHCVLLKTPHYMGGAFYFLSMDLAEYITGPTCPRAKLFFPHEDMTTGNYVYSHPQHDNITWVGEVRGYELIWRHAVKNPNRLVHFYQQYLQKLLLQGRLTKEQIQAWESKLQES